MNRYKCIIDIINKEGINTDNPAFTKDKCYNVIDTFEDGTVKFIDNFNEEHFITKNFLEKAFKSVIVALDEIDDMEDREAFELLKEYSKVNGIDIDKPIYTLAIEDVLCCIANSYKEDIASGKLTIEDCIGIIEDKLEIDWIECMQAVIDDRLINK